MINKVFYPIIINKFMKTSKSKIAICLHHLFLNLEQDLYQSIRKWTQPKETMFKCFTNNK